MKIKPGFTLKDICGEKVIIAQGIENIDFSRMISLNETAAFLWNVLAGRGEADERELTEALCDEYEVDRDTAAADVSVLCGQWVEQGLIEK